MKRRQFWCAIFLCLFIIFHVACFSIRPWLPSSSENFNEQFCADFSDHYTLNPHLIYVSAAEAEVQIVSNEAMISLALIDQVDKGDFVSGTLIPTERAMMGGLMCAVGVFQHKDAPSPMEDWTIERIEIYRFHGSVLLANSTNEAKAVAQNPMNEFQSATPLHTFYTEETNDAFASSLKSSCLSFARWDQFYKGEHGIFQPLFSREGARYIMLVRFQESDQLVWYSELWYRMPLDSAESYRDGVVYLRRSYEGMEGLFGEREDDFYAPLSEAFSASIHEILAADGCNRLVS